MVLWQAAHAVCYCLSNLFLGGYSAVISNVLIAVRNILLAKDKLNKWVTSLICVLIITIGIYFNNRGWLGLLPIVASVSYTILMYLVKTVQGMQLALISNLTQWTVFDFLLKSYPMFVMDVVIIGITVRNYLKGRNAQERMSE